jgi:hypothetical protein
MELAIYPHELEFMKMAGIVYEPDCLERRDNFYIIKDNIKMLKEYSDLDSYVLTIGEKTVNILRKCENGKIIYSDVSANINRGYDNWRLITQETPFKESTSEHERKVEMHTHYGRYYKMVATPQYSPFCIAKYDYSTGRVGFGGPSKKQPDKTLTYSITGNRRIANTLSGELSKKTHDLQECYWDELSGINFALWFSEFVRYVKDCNIINYSFGRDDIEEVFQKAVVFFYDSFIESIQIPKNNKDIFQKYLSQLSAALDTELGMAMSGATEKQLPDISILYDLVHKNLVKMTEIMADYDTTLNFLESNKPNLFAEREKQRKQVYKVYVEVKR